MGWRRLTLPQDLSCSTISAEELNFRVRDGIGWTLFAITTNPSFVTWGFADPMTGLNRIMISIGISNLYLSKRFCVTRSFASKRNLEVNSKPMR